VHQSSTSIYIPNVIEIRKTFFLGGLTAGTAPSSRSRDTKTRTNVKNPAGKKFRYCAVVYELVLICQLPLQMAEETDLKKCNFQNFRSPVTLTLTLDRVIWHTIVHQSSTSILPNFIEIGITFCGQTHRRTYVRDVRTDLLMDIYPPLMLLGRLAGVDLKM